MWVGAQALQAAKEAGKAPDTWYCLKLLDATGVLTVPGESPTPFTPQQLFLCKKSHDFTTTLGALCRPHLQAEHLIFLCT